MAFNLIAINDLLMNYQNIYKENYVNLNMKNKSILIGFILATFLISILSVSFVKAVPDDSRNSSNSNNPFDKIWKAINELQEKISDIQHSIFNLQRQLNNVTLIPGPQGLPGISEVRIAIFNITQQMYNGADISCNSDEFATGGGTQWFGDAAHSGILEFYPTNERTWRVKISDNIDYGVGAVRLVCVKHA